MTGPCMCGDPFCPSCFPGNDGGAAEAVLELISEEGAGLSAEAMLAVWRMGLAAFRAVTTRVDYDDPDIDEHGIATNKVLGASIIAEEEA